MGETGHDAVIVSMTGFAARQGAGPGCDWVWDIRSVNGKGLDLRLRLPDGIEGLEPALREAVGRVASRGNVSVTLRLSRPGAAEVAQLNPAGLEAALTLLERITAAANARGLELAAPRATDLATLRGVTEPATPAPDTGALRAALLADLPPLLAEFDAMRRAEGAALARVLAGQIDRIAALTEAAALAAEARRPEAAEALRAALARVMESAPGADPARVAQELAMIAVKSDVTEELDRLRAHVAAARALLHMPGPVGRKFDFLAQEFGREANTLCSKAGSAALTAIGLDLKHVIDQMREQIQNVE